MRHIIPIPLLVTLVWVTSSPAQNTAEVFEGLRAACAGCHQSGTRAFFASVRAFETLMVADPTLVRPGAPDESELIRLLEGEGTGAFTQMPIGARSYAEMAAAGDPNAPLSVADVRSWVSGLGPVALDARPNRDAARVRAMDATRIRNTLYAQLGLGFDDFFAVGGYFESADFEGFPIIMSQGDDANLPDEKYPILAPDEFPGLPGADNRTDTDAQGMERYFALGGGSITEQVRPNDALGPSFVLTLTQVAQAWCRFALEKRPNPALFPGGGELVGDEAAVKQVIRDWHLHFWAISPDDEAVDGVYDAVFAPLALGILPGDPGAGDPPAVEVGDCCEAHAGTGCSVPEIEACVCRVEDGYCCNNDWDQECANLVNDCPGFEGACGGGPGGAPDVETGYIGVCAYFIRHPNWIFY